MPATNAWNEASPAGSDLASQIDDFMRALKLDIREREAVDHIWNVSQADDGLHKSVTLKPTDSVTPITFSAVHSFTGSASGGIMDLSQTWNTTGLMTAIKVSITNTASHASSNLIQLLVGGIPVFHVSPAGVVYIANQLRMENVGTVNAPNIARNGDTNTGIYWQGDDVLQMVVGGVAAINFALHGGVTPTHSIPGGAYGVGARGSGIGIGANSSGAGAAGYLAFENLASDDYFMWFDATGRPRYHTSPPTEAGGDTSGTLFNPGTGGSGTFTADDGLVGTPSITFSNAATSGLYLADSATGDIRMSTLGVDGMGVSTFIGEAQANFMTRRVVGNSGLFGATTSGVQIIAGRNLSAGTAAGCHSYTAADGTLYHTWVDALGKLRIHLLAPTADGSVGDTDGTIVGTQS